MKFLLKSGLIALAIFLAPDTASAQCVKCNPLQQNCSWGPWIDGYTQCSTVGGDCVQAGSCAVTVRLDLDGSVLGDPLRTFPELRAFEIGVVASLVHSSGVASVAMWIDQVASLRDCRDFRLAGEVSSSVDTGSGLMSSLVL
jgi:hypothetical protein